MRWPSPRGWIFLNGRELTRGVCRLGVRGREDEDVVGRGGGLGVILVDVAVVVGVIWTSGEKEEALPRDDFEVGGVKSLISKIGTKSGAILRSWRIEGKDFTVSISGKANWAFFLRLMIFFFLSCRWWFDVLKLLLFFLWGSRFGSIRLLFTLGSGSIIA